MSKTILVTGGTGFIGSNLCKKLIQDKGNKIICVDNNFTGCVDNIRKLFTCERFKYIEHDIINPIEISEKIDEIYNLACPASPPAYQGKNSIFTTKTCIYGAINILELAKKHDAKVLQSSTSEIYGEPLITPQTETYRGNVNPIGIRACYDEGKRCAESLFFDYHRTYGVKIKIVRIFNTYGPLMAPDDGRVISNFITQGLKGKNLTIYGDGTQTRSFCYIDDLITALVLMMNTDNDFTGPVNLGNPEEYSIKKVAELVKAKINPVLDIVYKPLPEDDPSRRKPDITLATQKLHWTPKVNLSEGLDKTIEYFKIRL